MANDFKTPGVYVQEIATLPASVAQVPSAIPAFIGYVERLPGKEFQPEGISSLAEFRQKFGDGPPVSFTEIKLDSQNNLAVEPTPAQKFFLYDAIQLFYQNGGGDCYVVPIGKFEPTPSPTKQAFSDGLQALETEQDVTLIVMPDAVALNETMFEAQQMAMTHCAEMQNRFAILDLASSDVQGTTFRDKIGTGNSKFAAAYTPWLQANISKRVVFRDIDGNVTKVGVKFDLASLADSTTSATVEKLRAAIQDTDKVNAPLAESDTPLEQQFLEARNAFADAASKESYQKLFDLTLGVATWLDKLSGGDTKKLDDAQALNDLLAGSVKTSIEQLIEEGQTAGLLKGTEAAPFTSEPLKGVKLLSATQASVELDKAKASEPKIAIVFARLLEAVQQLRHSVAERERTLDGALSESFPLYQRLRNRLSQTLNVVPPSGAIAGIYARVDADRGVWKAPANVNVNGVVGLAHTIDNRAQERLNVDVNAGLSINAVRAFSGRGILVWGARTLAGNDGEWRYVPVRRLFIMVEESIRRSTNWVVFEPNDANTWIKVKAMIENYLIGLWRQGALAGATPEQAFFVNVGLGSSMTPQDILDGRMIIEVGMAAVRPAEFVILRFSHKLQEA